MMPEHAGQPGLGVAVTLPDPAIAEFLELRLSLVRINLSDAARVEEAREALRVVAREANHAIRNIDVRRPHELFASVCFAARSHVAEARQMLADARAERAELTRARRRLYRGLCLVAEALTATTRSRASQTDAPPATRGRGVLFAEFVTQVVAATRSNKTDVAWVLHVAEAELGVAAAHPAFSRLSAEQRSSLRALRGEIVAWSAGDPATDSGYLLLNRLILLVDCLNH